MQTTSKLIKNPLSLDADVLLRSIELDGDAFCKGRRNDDMVNWFIAKRLSEIRGPGTNGSYTERYYLQQFKALDLSGLQWDSLREWVECSVDEKIHRLYAHYSNIEDVNALANIWLPAFYDVAQPDTMPLFDE